MKCVISILKSWVGNAGGERERKREREREKEKERRLTLACNANRNPYQDSYGYT